MKICLYCYKYFQKIFQFCFNAGFAIISHEIKSNAYNYIINELIMYTFQENINFKNIDVTDNLLCRIVSVLT